MKSHLTSGQNTSFEVLVNLTSTGLRIGQKKTSRHNCIITVETSHLHETKWVFPKIGVPQNGIMENPIKMDDLGVPLFLETPK